MGARGLVSPRNFCLTSVDASLFNPVFLNVCQVEQIFHGGTLKIEPYLSTESVRVRKFEITD